MPQNVTNPASRKGFGSVVSVGEVILRIDNRAVAIVGMAHTSTAGSAFGQVAIALHVTTWVDARGNCGGCG